MLVRYIILFIALFVGTWLGSLFLPWWFAGLLALVLGLWRPLPGLASFSCGALSLSLLWFVQIALINGANEGLLLSRLEVLFAPLPLYWLSLLIAFFLGGLGMLTGSYAHLAFFEKENNRRRRR